MRGRQEPQVTMFAFVDLEERVPADHPLRAIKALADEALARLSPEFARMYADGDPSHQSEDPPPERLGRHGSFAQTNPGRPTGQVMCDYLDRQPGAVGGETPRRHVVQPNALLEVAYGVLDLGVAAMRRWAPA